MQFQRNTSTPPSTLLACIDAASDAWEISAAIKGFKNFFASPLRHAFMMPNFIPFFILPPKPGHKYQRAVSWPRFPFYNRWVEEREGLIRGQADRSQRMDLSSIRPCCCKKRQGGSKPPTFHHSPIKVTKLYARNFRIHKMGLIADMGTRYTRGAKGFLSHTVRDPMSCGRRGS